MKSLTCIDSELRRLRTLRHGVCKSWSGPLILSVGRSNRRVDPTRPTLPITDTATFAGYELKLDNMRLAWNHSGIFL